ncbi:hypothetical protein GCM10027070_03200 [Barrientosiimonas humi]
MPHRPVQLLAGDALRDLRLLAPHRAAAVVARGLPVPRTGPRTVPGVPLGPRPAGSATVVTTRPTTIVTTRPTAVVTTGTTAVITARTATIVTTGPATIVTTGPATVIPTGPATV